MKRYLLVDCNNFFVSCERVFNPAIRNKPVVVLSSNDGCVIARSNEAKALGIKMGEPFFQCKDIIKQYNVYYYSANFALYSDMSNRVMQTLMMYCTDIEVYSIDEAFIHIHEHTDHKAFNDVYYREFADFLVKKVKQCTGLPISIGIGSTKTLAKLANGIAKKQGAYNGVFDFSAYTDYQVDEILEQIEISEIWGVGHRYAKMLQGYGIKTVKAFKYTHEKTIRKMMTVVGLKTLWEILGKSCLPLSQVIADKQTIMVSRSFGIKITGLHEMKEAVAQYATNAAVKLRKQRHNAYTITVSVVSKRYVEAPTYYHSQSYNFAVATSYTPDLIKAAHECLALIYKQGYEYKKAVVVLSQLVPYESQQLNIYKVVEKSEEKYQLMKCIDKANTKYGKNKVTFAAVGTKQPWRMKQLHKTPAYTTNWFELLTVDIST